MVLYFCHVGLISQTMLGYEKVREAFDQHQYSKADSLLEYAIEELDSKSEEEQTELLFFYGKVKLHNRKVDDALDLFVRMEHVAKGADLQVRYAEALEAQANIHNIRNDRLKVIEVATRLLKIPDLRGDLFSEGHTILGSALVSISEIDSGIHHLKIAVEHDRKTQDTNSMKFSLISLGKAYLKVGNLEQTRDLYYESAGIMESTGDVMRLPSLYTELSNMQYGLLNIPSAKEYALKAINLAPSSKWKSTRAKAFISLGKAQLHQGDYTQAISSFDSCLTLMNTDTSLTYILEALLGKADGLFQEGESRESMEILGMIRPAIEGSKESYTNVHYNNLRARHLMKEDKYLEASKILNKSSQFLDGSANIFLVREWHQLKSLCNERLGLFKQSLRDQRAFQSISDSIYRIAQVAAIQEVDTRYQTDLREKEIRTLSAENELNRVQLKSFRQRAYGLGGALLIFGSFLVIVFRLLGKTKMQNNVISKALKEKEILLREIHHRVKNNLQFISSLLALQTEHVEDSIAFDALQEGQDRVQSMALIHQNLYREENLTGVNLQEYFLKLIRGLFESYNIRKEHINLKLEIEDINLDVDSVIPIGLIVNELVSNSLKYAFPDGASGTIKVGLYETPGELHISVADNGIGLSEEVKSRLGESFGYRLINVFKEQLNAQLIVDGVQGTKVSMKIKNYNLA